MANELTIRGKTTATSLALPKSITDEEWLDLGVSLGKFERSKMWWVGDWLKHKYPDGNADYRDLEDQTTLEHGTMKQALYVCRNILPSNRFDALGFLHHAIVAPLPEVQQRKWLEKAVKESLTVRQLREAIRAESLEIPILPEGRFDVILTDPPWSYRNSGFEMSAENKYPTMETSDICAYKDGTGKLIQDCIADNAVCFMWSTNPLLQDALQVMPSWGFEYKTNMVWVKDSHTAGFYVYGMHELLLIGVRGNKMLPLESAKPKSVITGKSTRHSEKPEAVYEMIEAMYPGRSYLEVFARTNRKGWASVGNQN